MKIKPILNFCKKRKSIHLADGLNGVQWLGDGYCLYPLRKMPILDKDSIFTIMEVPEDKQSGFYFNGCDVPYAIDFNDVDEKELMVERTDILIIQAEKQLQPLNTSQGILFIDNKYLSPLAEYEMLELYERTSGSGTTYIAAKEGLILMGIIMPVNVVNKEFVQELEQLTHSCKVALFNKGEAAE